MFVNWPDTKSENKLGQLKGKIQEAKGHGKLPESAQAAEVALQLAKAMHLPSTFTCARFFSFMLVCHNGFR